MIVIGQVISQQLGKEKGFYITFREKETGKLYRCFNEWELKHNPADKKQRLDIRRGYNKKCWLVNSLQFNQQIIEKKEEKFETLQNYQEQKEQLLNGYQNQEKLELANQRIKVLEELVRNKEKERLEQELSYQRKLSDKDYSIKLLKRQIENKPEYQHQNIINYLDAIDHKENKTEAEKKLL